MENITSVKIMPISKVFDNSHMILTLPINEQAMSAEMLEEYHRETDGGGFESCETTLQIDVFADGTKFFTFNVNKYYSDGNSDSSGLYLADLSPELEGYYYNMAVKQFAENLKKYSK